MREHLRKQQVERDNEDVVRLTAAAVNTFFGAENEDAAYKAFVQANRKHIDETLSSVATELATLQIPLTDALRTMVMCDFQEDGRDSSALLQRAQEVGILLVDRNLPLPNHFIALVRRLGQAKGILQT